MRLADLSCRSGLSTATIKYYLRAGVLAPGITDGSTWARYNEGHLRRLRLVRALTEVAGLSLEDVRRVIDAVAASGSEHSEHQARGAAQWPLPAPMAQEPSVASIERVEALLTRHGWELDASSPHRRTLAAALDTLEGLDFPASDEILDVYAEALEPVAEVEVPRVATEAQPMVAAERLVVGTLLYEPVLLTMRRMAHEALSARS